MANPPTDTTKEVKNQVTRAPWNIPGAIGFFGESFEQDSEIVSGFPREGTIYFKAAKDLIIENILGLGNVTEQASEVASKAWENHPPTQAEAVAQQTDAKVLEDAQKIKTLQNWFEQIATAQSSESYEQSMNESLRITGRAVTEEDAQRVGVSVSKENLLRTSTLHRIAEKDEEVNKQAVGEKSEKSLAETQPVVNMNAIMEGGTGGAKANISQTGGGAG